MKTICTTNCAWSATERLVGALVADLGKSGRLPPLASGVGCRRRRRSRGAERPGVARREVLALPGVGPCATAHAMMLIGRYGRLILDSWTRPKYARLNGGKPVKDAAIERRFRRYGPWAGLAFWLYLTRDWVED